jgi:methyl-accepting chemotaxis protein
VVLWLFFRAYTQLLVIAGFIGPLILAAGLYPVLHRRGQANIGIYLYLSALLLVLAVLPILIPQLLPTAAIAYAVTFAVAYLLLGSRGSLAFVIAIFLAFVADTLVVEFVPLLWFTPLGEEIGSAIGAVLSVFALGIAAVVIRLIVVGQEEQYREAQRANLEIERRVITEQKQREQLQQANLEIEERVTVEREQRRRLHHILTEIREAAGSLATGTTEILAAITQQATGASEQSVAISQASSTIDQVRTIAEQTAQRAQGVAGLAQRTAEVSHTGQQAVADTVAGVTGFKGKAESIAQHILDLSEKAQAIGGIISIVEEIADQSNMLALNAAVEAARAGETGRGFSVVAQEVRSLADRSMAATEEVKSILTEIQHGVNSTVIAAEEGMKEADAGMKLAGEAGRAIQDLAENVADSTGAAEQIAAAAGQQQAGVEQIGLVMETIRQVTAQSVTGAQQVERAAGELNDLARQLQELVEQYQL